MKRNKVLTFTLAAFTVAGLAACGGTQPSNERSISINAIQDTSVTIPKYSYTIGETVTFSVSTTRDGYVLVVNDGGNREITYTPLGNDNYSFVMPDYNVVINSSGYYDPQPTYYDVTVNKDDGIGVTISQNQFTAGSVVGVQIDYDYEYTFEVVKTKDSSPVTYTGSDPHYEFTMPAEAVTINVRKSAATMYSISQHLDDGITVSGIKQGYSEGSEVTFSVTSSVQYSIELVGATSTLPIEYTGTGPYKFTMPAENVTLNITKVGVDPLKRKLTFNERYQDIWDTDGNVYNEQVLLYTHADGSTYGELLYEPTSVTEVKDYLMTKIFTKDTDFEVSGRKIIVKNVATTKMPYLTQDQYNAVPTSLAGTEIGTLDSSKTSSGKVLYSEYPHIVKKTVLVTYQTEDAWEGHEMYQQGNLLPKTLAKLAQKGTFNLSIYGDSNATGAVTSGYWKEDYEGTHPGASTLFGTDYDFQDGFPRGFEKALEEVYGVECNLYSPGEGGKTSAWSNQNPEAGSKNIWTKQNYDSSKTRVDNWLTDQVPDLVVLVYGNNDISFGVDAATFVSNLDTTIKRVKEINANAEFIISLPKRSNPKADQDNVDASQSYLNAIKKYVYDANGGVAFHDMTTLSADLLNKKEPYSLFGNGINHSNDFLARQWVSLFINTLRVPLSGYEWDYSKDDTITNPTIDYAKDWVNVVSDTVTKETPTNVDNGVNLPSLSSWAEGYAYKKKVYLDGLEFEFKGNRMKYGGSVAYKDYPSYLLSTSVGFFFSKSQGTWTGAYPFNGFAFNLNDIYGQNRIFVGADNNYNGNTIMYTDPSCTQIFSSNATNQMVLNRLPNGDDTDHAGVKVKFEKVTDTVYSITIKSLFDAYMWENNPNYDSTTKSCKYYLKASSFANVLNTDGSTYINVFGYGPEYNGAGYGGDMSVDLTKIVSTEPAPIALGDETQTYVVGSGKSIKYYYDPVVETSLFGGLERGKNLTSLEAIDIAHRSYGKDEGGYYVLINNVGLEYIATNAGTGVYYIVLKCSNGSCSWKLNITNP